MTAPELLPTTVTALVLTHPEPTAWSLFLDHAMSCADCRTGERCAAGNQLHDAVRAGLDAAAP